MKYFWKHLDPKKEGPPIAPQAQGQRETERLTDPNSISSEAVRCLEKIMERERRRARRNTGTVMLVESETRQFTPPQTTFSDDEDYVRNVFESPGAKFAKKAKGESTESYTKTQRS